MASNGCPPVRRSCPVPLPFRLSAPRPRSRPRWFPVRCAVPGNPGCATRNFQFRQGLAVRVCRWRSSGRRSSHSQCSGTDVFRQIGAQALLDAVQALAWVEGFISGHQITHQMLAVDAFLPPTAASRRLRSRAGALRFHPVRCGSRESSLDGGSPTYSNTPSLRRRARSPVRYRRSPGAPNGVGTNT